MEASLPTDEGTLGLFGRLPSSRCKMMKFIGKVVIKLKSFSSIGRGHGALYTPPHSELGPHEASCTINVQDRRAILRMDIRFYTGI